MKIKTNSGIVLGKVDKGIFSFKGIPYAEPPIGSNRWLPPKSVSAWQGVKDCFEYGPICPQNELAYDHESAEIGQAKKSQSEDCLTLNIWTPEKNTSKLPVKVWIHGGAFWMGSGDEEVLNPDNILTGFSSNLILTFSKTL